MSLGLSLFHQVTQLHTYCCFKKIFDDEKRIMYEINGWCRLFHTPIYQKRPFLPCHINLKTFFLLQDLNTNDKENSSEKYDEIS